MVLILPELTMQMRGEGQVPGWALPSLAAPWAPREMWGCHKPVARHRAWGPSQVFMPPNPEELQERMDDPRDAARRRSVVCVGEEKTPDTAQPWLEVTPIRWLCEKGQMDQGDLAKQSP